MSRQRDDLLRVSFTSVPTGKKRRTEQKERKRHAGSSSTSERPRQQSAPPVRGSDTVHAKPAPSNVLHKLAALRTGPTSCPEQIPVVRSLDLAKKPEVPEPSQALQERGIGTSTASTSLAGLQKRDENLVIVEDLEMGPMDHNPPADDPLFERLEPNSGIHLLYVAFVVKTNIVSE